MTLQELMEYPKPTVPPTIAAKFLGCDPWSLNVAAKEGHLGLFHYFAGRNLRIAKWHLIDYLGYYSGKRGEVVRANDWWVEDDARTDLDTDPSIFEAEEPDDDEVV